MKSKVFVTGEQNTEVPQTDANTSRFFAQSRRQHRRREYKNTSNFLLKNNNNASYIFMYTYYHKR